MLNDRLYVLGGATNATVDVVRYASIDGDGAIGAWQTAPSLPQPLYRHAVTAYNNVIYVVGGFNSSTSQASSAVYYARVNSNGSLGPWQNASLPTARFYHRAVIHDGRLLVLGGIHGTTELAEVISAVIDFDGRPLPWEREPDLPETLQRSSAVSVSRDGSDFVYVLGGLHGTAYRAAVYHSNLPPTLPFSADGWTSGNGYADAYTVLYPDTYPDKHPDKYPNLAVDADLHVDSNAHSNANAHTHAHATRHTHRQPNTDANTDATQHRHQPTRTPTPTQTPTSGAHTDADELSPSG